MKSAVFALNDYSLSSRAVHQVPVFALNLSLWACYSWSVVAIITYSLDLMELNVCISYVFQFLFLFLLSWSCKRVITQHYLIFEFVIPLYYNYIPFSLVYACVYSLIKKIISLALSTEKSSSGRFQLNQFIKLLIIFCDARVHYKFIL